MTINLTKYFGLNLRRMTGSDDKTYLCLVAWYSLDGKQLRYVYGSCRSI